MIVLSPFSNSYNKAGWVPEYLGTWVQAGWVPEVLSELKVLDLCLVSPQDSPLNLKVK